MAAATSVPFASSLSPEAQNAVERFQMWSKKYKHSTAKATKRLWSRAYTLVDMGHDIGVNLKMLIEALVAETQIPRIRVGSLEPWDLPEGFSHYGAKRLDSVRISTSRSKAVAIACYAAWRVDVAWMNTKRLLLPPARPSRT